LSIANGLTIGKFLEAQATLTLSTPAPVGGLPVTLTSNSGLLKLSTNGTDAGASSILINIPQGVSFATYWVYSLGSAGAATYSGAAPGYTSTGDDSVTLTPSGIVVFPLASTTMANGGSSSFGVSTAQLSVDGLNTPQSQQNLAGNLSLTVALTNSNPTIGKLNGSASATVNIAIAPGTSVTNVSFTPTASGSTTVSVTQPPGWSTPANFPTGSSTQIGFLVF